MCCYDKILVNVAALCNSWLGVCVCVCVCVWYGVNGKWLVYVGV